MSEARLIGSGTMTDPYRLVGVGDYRNLHIEAGVVRFEDTSLSGEVIELVLPDPVARAYTAREAIKEAS